MMVTKSRPTSYSGAAPGINWRDDLPSAARQRVINKIVEALTRYLSLAGKDGFQELREIAEQFEEKMYRVASCESDYLSRLSKKMFTLETSALNSLPTLPSKSTPNTSNPAQLPDEASASNWRDQMLPSSRLRTVEKLVETLEMNPPVSGGSELEEFRKIAVRTEEMTYNTAKNELDYVERISLRMFMMETNSENNLP